MAGTVSRNAAQHSRSKWLLRRFIAFQILIPVFFLDSILNAGFVVATNGFMLTKSPSGNRTMFIAAGTALAGFVGGVTSVVCGGLLTWGNLDSVVFGVPLSAYRMLFAVSILLRIASVLLAVRIRESGSHGTRHVVSQLIGATPLRMIHFPVGLFRSDTQDHVSETIGNK